MKKELIIGALSVAILAAIAAWSFLEYRLSENYYNPGQTNGIIPLVQPANGAQSGSVSLDMATVALHNSPADCWVAIGGNVYALSGFLSAHPGGAQEIIPVCGKDGTSAFASRGGTGQHSSYANQLLSGYRIGALNTSVPADRIQSIRQATPPPLPAGYENEYEDD